MRVILSMINCARVLRVSPGNSLPLTKTSYSSVRVKLSTCKRKMTFGDDPRPRVPPPCPRVFSHP